jgi:hypothetical protein
VGIDGGGGANTTLTVGDDDTGDDALPVVVAVHPRSETVLKWVGVGRYHYSSASNTVDIGAFNTVREHTIIDHLGWQRVEVLTDTQCTVIAHMDANQFLQVCATQNISLGVIAPKASQLAHEEVDRQIQAHHHSDEEEVRRNRKRCEEDVRLERNRDEEDVRRRADEEVERERRQMMRQREEEQNTTMHTAKLLEIMPPAKILQCKQIALQTVRMATRMVTLATKTVNTWENGTYTMNEMWAMFTHAFPMLSAEQFLSDAAVEGRGFTMNTSDLREY